MTTFAKNRFSTSLLVCGEKNELDLGTIKNIPFLMSTAVSRKAVLHSGKSSRDNVESYYG